MYYEIYKDGKLINTIVGDESFIVSYCEANGYTYIAKEYDKPEETETVDIEATLIEATIDHEIRISELELAML